MHITLNPAPPRVCHLLNVPWDFNRLCFQPRRMRSLSPWSKLISTDIGGCGETPVLPCFTLLPNALQTVIADLPQTTNQAKQFGLLWRFLVCSCVLFFPYLMFLVPPVCLSAVVFVCVLAWVWPSLQHFYPGFTTTYRQIVVSLLW